MKADDRIKQLETIAGMILDLRLADLRQAARLRQESLDRLGALEVPPAEDMDPITAARINLQYQAWADRRRAEINLVLARQTADWTMRRAEAKEAFARSEALRMLRERAGRGVRSPGA